MILLLEDNSERVERFTKVLRSLDPLLPVRVWRRADAFIVGAEQLLTSVVLISLDHDLEPESDESDPGDGYMVAKWLTKQPVALPVILHSSNTERTLWMAGEFDLAGWRHWRVAPIGDDWIEVDWKRVVRRLLRRKCES